AMMIALVGRTYDLAIVRGDALAEAAESNATRVAPSVSARGLIVDRTGNPLAGNQGALSLQIDRDALPDDEEDKAALLAKVAKKVGVSEKFLRKSLIPCGTENAPNPPRCNEGDPAFPVIALLGVRYRQVHRIVEIPERFPGVSVVEHGQRSYPRSKVSMGHVLGYVGRITKEELADDPGRSPTALVGRSGLEQQYEKELSGVAGVRRSEVDAFGRVTNRDQPKDPEIGATLVTSIDQDLQLAVERSLAAKIGDSGKAGGAVVLDVKTGRVLAMASYPTYHPDVWTNGISKTDYRQLAKSGALLNQPLQGTYAPGSTFKPVTALAMYRTGEGLNDIYACPSSINVGGHSFSNYGGSGHGPITLATALRVSCNTVFYRAAEKLWREGGGERKSKKEYDPIAKAAKDVGLGRSSGIDLPGAAAGIVASPAAKYALWQDRKEAWCAGAKSGYRKLAKTKPGLAADFTALDTENCNSGHMWRQGDAMNAGVGQGTTAISPLQMAGAYATLLGDGRHREPTVGRALVYPNGKVKKIKAKKSKVVVDSTMRKFLRSALSGVTRSGTASGVFGDFPLDKYQVMGKTGTAQVDGKEDTSWFTSAAPAEDPQYAVAVTVARGGTGGETSAPITKKIYEAIYGVGRPAVMPVDGPKYDIPKVKPLVNPRVAEKEKIAAKEKAKAKKKAKALRIKAEAQERAQARASAKKSQAKAAESKAKAKASKARAKLAAAKAKAKQKAAKAKVSAAQKRADAAQAKAEAAAAAAAKAARTAKVAKKNASDFTKDKLAAKAKQKAKKSAKKAAKQDSARNTAANSAALLPGQVKP
ncbi:MAG: hypothetical protein K0U64_06765, partial [Actinomycetia bacterium]|nr:hypothetical protein [Actinomycetes bacterium]